jgi:hypothetical protein
MYRESFLRAADRFMRVHHFGLLANRSKGQNYDRERYSVPISTLIHGLSSYLQPGAMPAELRHDTFELSPSARP